jgi:hypothetical protein
MTDDLRAELVQRNAEHGTEWYVLLNDDQAADLASGFVPQSVKAMVRCMLDWRDEDRRRAERPVPTPKRSGGRGKRSGGTPE